MSSEKMETVIDDQAQSGGPQAEAARQVEELRADVDTIDAAIVGMLAERFRVTHRIGLLKAQAGFASADLRREASQIAALRDKAEDYGLDPNLAEAYLHLVADAAKQGHEQLASQLGSR
ncbi:MULTISPECIES: chorismate mutase [Bifidobacterium]|uniref:chorismate mutase n=1 Tax=Bifidobacterium TaxID=1678 RepID=UPI0018DC3869|nr:MULTISPECIES: chorismate mutase [Bifidobacterium]MBI0145852.1 chorismate mutase [Bifidobacterium polysaccharolyticum]MBI0152680.1 chorismate mutase [Bifidobacterium sp. M0399]